MAIRRTSFSPYNRAVSVSQETLTLRRKREVWTKMCEVLWVCSYLSLAPTAYKVGHDEGLQDGFDRYY